LVTAAQMNANIRDAGNFMLTAPYCNVFRSAALSPANNTLTLVSWDAETEDNDAMHSTGTNPSRIICQTPGVFGIAAAVSWVTAASLTARRISVRLNAAGASAGGTLVLIKDDVNTGSTFSVDQSVPLLFYNYRMVNIGDYLEMFIEQESGGTLAITPGANCTYFQMKWIGA
jgi:hypothetical protein